LSVSAFHFISYLYGSQLEAIIRISESLAKMSLSPVASEEHVDEAVRLFKVSTMQAVQSGHSRKCLLENRAG